MNYSRQKLQRVSWRAFQIAFLIAVFVVGGFFLPTRLAPAVFEYLPFSTPQEQQTKQWSVQITNRNADSGEEFLVAARNPDRTIAISAISYSCAIDDVQLVFEADDGNKQLPCGTDIVLPNQSDYRLRVYTDRSKVGYLPIALSVTNGDKVRDISVVLATARVNTDEKSRVNDQAVVTFEEI